MRSHKQFAMGLRSRSAVTWSSERTIEVDNWTSLEYWRLALLDGIQAGTPQLAITTEEPKSLDATLGAPSAPCRWTGCHKNEIRLYLPELESPTRPVRPFGLEIQNATK